MKPCSAHRESLALLACGALPDDEADELHQHLQACANCREYFRQMTAVCEDHTTAARHRPDAEFSPRLLGRITSAIRADADRQRNDPFFGDFTRWARIAGVAVLLMLLLGGAMLFRKPTPPVPVAGTRIPPPTRTANPPAVSINLIAYRLALNRSPEDLDELLALEAARPTFNPSSVFRVGLARLDPGF